MVDNNQSTEHNSQVGKDNTEVVHIPEALAVSDNNREVLEEEDMGMVSVSKVGEFQGKV